MPLRLVTFDLTFPKVPDRCANTAESIDCESAAQVRSKTRAAQVNKGASCLCLCMEALGKGALHTKVEAGRSACGPCKS